MARYKQGKAATASVAEGASKTGVESQQKVVEVTVQGESRKVEEMKGVDEVPKDVVAETKGE